MIARLLQLTALLLVALCACAEEPVRFEPFLGRGLALHAQVNGADGYFLFDTGGGVTNISPEFATKIGCKPWGQITGFTMMAQRIDMQRCDHVRVRVGGREVERASVGVFDGSSMMPPNAPHLDGTIALDVLDGMAFQLSVAEKTLTLLDAKQLATVTRGRAAMPVQEVRDAEGFALAVDLPVKTPLGTAWFELDSGNTSPIALVGKHLAEPLKLDAASGANKKNEQTTLTLEDGTTWTGDVRVFNLILDGNLGSTFLMKYAVVVDLAKKQAWLLPSAVQKTP